MKLIASKLGIAMALGIAAASLVACGAGDMNDVNSDDANAVDGEDGAVSDELELGELEQGLASCTNTEGTSSVMAAIAVAAAQELKRWQPTKDFAVGRVDGDEAVVLSATGKARCADKVCAKTQALLDLQQNAANGKVKFPGKILLNNAALRTRLRAKFNEQQTCEAQPDNHRAENCPVEEHTLTFLRAEKGGCDTNFFFQAKSPTGTALKYPAQLKNKLLWADRTNQYIGFQNVGDVVSIDPTYGLNDDGTTSTGACTAACTKISVANVAGGCCSCDGVTKKFAKSAWSAVTFLCQ